MGLSCGVLQAERLLAHQNTTGFGFYQRKQVFELIQFSGLGVLVSEVPYTIPAQLRGILVS